VQSDGLCRLRDGGSASEIGPVQATAFAVHTCVDLLLETSIAPPKSGEAEPTERVVPVAS